MNDVYTATLGSTFELSIPIQASFGDIIVTGLLLCFCAVMGLEFLVKMVYRK